MKIRTTFVYPPIPIRQFDWSATEDDYEPGCPQGTGATEDDAVADLLTQIEEKEPDKVERFWASAQGQTMLAKAGECHRFWAKPYEEETAKVRAGYAEWMKRMEKAK